MSALGYRPETIIYHDAEEDRIYISQDRHDIHEDNVTVFFTSDDISKLIKLLQSELEALREAQNAPVRENTEKPS